MGKITQDFIKKIAKGAIEAYDKYGVLPSLTIAQGILESGSGKASIGNNIFGIKASPKWKGKTQKVRTAEYDANRKKYYIMADFRDYDSIEDCIVDHAKLLSMPRYKKVISAKNYKEACVAIQACGYASDPSYSKLLISIIEYNKLYEYDKPQIDIYTMLSNAKIISSISYWKQCETGYPIEPQYVKTVIMNYYQYIVGSRNTIEESLKFIVNRGLLSSPEYWLDCINNNVKANGLYVKTLLENMAGSIK